MCCASTATPNTVALTLHPEHGGATLVMNVWLTPVPSMFAPVIPPMPGSWLQ
jgi:hypothetical protein